jgi:hypothetical protein
MYIQMGRHGEGCALFKVSDSHFTAYNLPVLKTASLYGYQNSGPSFLSEAGVTVG